MTSSGSNIFFNNFNSFSEQDLVESLIVESISIYGHNVFYCPRTINSKDEVYGTDTISSYNNAYNIDMYIKSFDSYEGDGTFLSKFNLEIRDQITLVVANRTFAKDVITHTQQVRPNEGDLIYSNMMHRLFVIKYVNNKPSFYQMGALQMFELVCEVFEYSNEHIRTGIPEIDAIETKYSFAGDGSTQVSNSAYEDAFSDVFETNNEFQLQGNNILDWTETDPFSSGSI
jgi:hypothetical protein